MTGKLKTVNFIRNNIIHTYTYKYTIIKILKLLYIRLLFSLRSFKRKHIICSIGSQSNGNNNNNDNTKWNRLV